MVSFLLNLAQENWLCILKQIKRKLERYILNVGIKFRKSKTEQAKSSNMKLKCLVGALSNEGSYSDIHVRDYWIMKVVATCQIQDFFIMFCICYHLLNPNSYRLVSRKIIVAASYQVSSDHWRSLQRFDTMKHVYIVPL